MQFFKKKKPIITEEDQQELYNLRREAYMEKARELIKLQAQEKAKNDLGIKQKKEGVW